jgi:hypothetical protein
VQRLELRLTREDEAPTAPRRTWPLFAGVAVLAVAAAFVTLRALGLLPWQGAAEGGAGPGAGGDSTAGRGDAGPHRATGAGLPGDLPPHECHPEHRLADPALRVD